MSDKDLEEKDEEVAKTILRIGWKYRQGQVHD